MVLSRLCAKEGIVEDGATVLGGWHLRTAHLPEVAFLAMGLTGSDPELSMTEVSGTKALLARPCSYSWSSGCVWPARSPASGLRPPGGGGDSGVTRPFCTLPGAHLGAAARGGAGAGAVAARGSPGGLLRSCLGCNPRKLKWDI